MANKGATTSSVYIPVERLRVGLYVFIDLPWFQHPFTLNSFRIASCEQINTLRTLGERRFRYDPERSDSEVPDDEAASEAFMDADAQDLRAAPANDAPDAVAPPAAPRAGENPLPAGTQERVRLLSERRLRIEQVDKAFLKSSAILRNLNRNLLNKPDETLQEMGVLVEQMVFAFLDTPEVTLHVMGDKCGGDETYSHSLNVAVLSMMLARGLDLQPEQARVLGLGALLHDIGLIDVPDRVLKKRHDEYTKPERELRALHCEFGLRIGQQIGLPPDVLAIIAQHHEMADGSGYPLGVKGGQTALPVRVVALANCYDNLCNPVDPAQAMTPHDALSVMFGQRRGKFDTAILQQMIRSLGVYPPGSVVSLSNEAIAMVLSINPAKPLRPWVMLYDKEVPKEQALLLDLERETGIVITKALRPALLPPATYAYLSPRRRVSYFFDSRAAPVLP